MQQRFVNKASLQAAEQEQAVCNFEFKQLSQRSISLATATEHSNERAKLRLHRGARATDSESRAQQEQNAAEPVPTCRVLPTSKQSVEPHCVPV